MGEKRYTFEFTGACTWHKPPRIGEAHTAAEMIQMVCMDAVDGGTEFDFVSCREDGTPRTGAKVSRIGIAVDEFCDRLRYYAYFVRGVESPEERAVYISLARTCQRLSEDIYS